MSITPLGLLRERSAFWGAVRGGRVSGREVAGLLAFIVLASGLYGAVLAGWRSPRLSLYVAVKLPALFLATTALVALFNWMIAALLGAGLRLRTTLLLVVASLTLAAWMLLALTPVALFFLLTGVPAAGGHDAMRFAHNCILVTHIAILAMAGVAGNAALFGGLRALVSPRCPVSTLFGLWLTAFAFVGCQMAWVLRPFVGSPFYPVAFMRPDCLDRNFYEFVFGEVLPYIFGGGR